MMREIAQMTLENPTRETPRIDIRALKAADLDGVMALAACLPDAPHWSREQYSEVLRPGSPLPRMALVAVDSHGGEIAGFIVAGQIVPEAELEAIAVAANRQRQGIGSALLTSLIDRLKPLGVLELHLEVRASNHSAKHLYQSKNFKEIGVRARYYADPEEDAVLMALNLG